ncbi:MAG: HAD-IB family hydrolase, partial [Gallionella sp.]|nr:HAD-IB family hydrolase [Gallionella sp.]
HARSTLDMWHEQFMRESVMPMITQPARELVQQHRDAGDVCVIITATNSFVTGPIARQFGIEHLIATDPEHQDGEFTGRVAGVPRFREGKITRLNNWLAEHDWTLASFEDSTFYSDSLNDLPLMNCVQHPVAANPDATLRAHAEQHGWPVIALR